MPQKRPFRFYICLLILLLTQGRAFAVDASDFQARTFTDAQGKTLNYRLYVPKNYKAGEKYPLILFLHGSGERGSDNQKQVGYFAASVFADDFTQAKNPCFLVAPQCPEKESWAAIHGTKQDVEFSAAPTEPMRLTIAMLTALQKEFSVDKNRLYITGLSMGGYGTWDALARYPGLFAAAIPICGGGDPATAKKFANTPLWGFHGGADPTVPPARSHHLMIALQDAGGQPKFTEYPGVGHNSWEKAYREPGLEDWLFLQHLSLPKIAQAVRKKPLLAGKSSFSRSGLIAVWRANEKNDKAIRDLSKNRNDLTLENGQTAIQEGNVLNFTDSQPILTFDPKPANGFNNGFTLAAWFRADPGHYEPETLFSMPSRDGKSGYSIGLDETHWLKTAAFFSSENTKTTFPCPPGWHHVAILSNGWMTEIYFDGNRSFPLPIGEKFWSEVFYRLQIGGDAQGKNPFFGKMNDIRLYNRALTDAEIANLAGKK